MNGNLFYIVIFIFGATVGSFLNVCVYRLARGASLIWPPSHCPTCSAAIKWHDNIPIISYLALGGRCRSCYSTISPRYMLIEALTGVMFCYIFYCIAPGVYRSMPARDAAMLLVYLTMACALVVSTFIDFERQMIPDEVTISGIFLGPILSVIFPVIHQHAVIVQVPFRRAGIAWNDAWLAQLMKAGLPSITTDHTVALATSIAGIAVGGGSIYLAAVLGRAIFKREAMGMGDVKLMAMIGGVLGAQGVLLTFLVGCIVGSVVGLALLAITRKSRIPFGPYLSFGALAVMLHRGWLIDAISRYSLGLQDAFSRMIQ